MFSFSLTMLFLIQGKTSWNSDDVNQKHDQRKIHETEQNA